MEEITYPSISLCMIAKNEEEMLEQCLNSVKPIVSEIIFVDTGSTDKTIEIAESFGAKIHHFKWCDDFAAARNYSIKYATGDWIFVMDPDEVIAEKELRVLQEKTLNKGPMGRGICYEFLQRHYTNSYQVSGYRPCVGEFSVEEKKYPGYFESNLCRMFPNHKGIHFRGKLHELVEHSIRELNIRLERCHVRIHHYGHTPETKAKKDKSKIYIPLSASKASEKKTDWKSYYELGIEYSCNNEFEKSQAALEESAKLNDKHIETWINLGYVLCEQQKFADAEQAFHQALRINPDAEESYCNLGVTYIRSGKFNESVDYLSHAVKLNPLYVNAWVNMATALSQLGRISEAANVLCNAIDIMPQCSEAIADLGFLFLMGSKEHHVAKSLISKALEINPNCTKANMYIQHFQPQANPQ